MKNIYEVTKTIILIVLVLISIVLTWSLWTYQPTLEQIEKDQDLVVEKPAINQKEVENLIKPLKLLFHHNNRHFGTYEELEIDKLLKQVNDWELYDIRNLSPSIDKDQFTSFIKENGHVEIIFSDRIPLEMLRTFFNITDKDHLTLTFDRIIIDVYDEEDGAGHVYFISYDEQKVYEAKVNYEDIKDFQLSYYPIAATYPEQIEYPLTEMSTIYLPKNALPINRIRFYRNMFDINHFVDHLFTDPNVVKKDILRTGEVYTDGARLLRVHSDQKYIQFVNPMNLTTNNATVSDLINSSVEYVNEHGGWLDEYRYFSSNIENQQTIFRLYYNNFPIFNRSGLSEIIQYWGRNEIKEYRHPLLNLSIRFDTRETKLPDGEKVFNQIKSYPEFNPALLKDITIGYELIEDTKTNLILLEPMWCYLYNANWIKVEMQDTDNLGEDENGLE